MASNQIPAQLKAQTPELAEFLLEINKLCKKHGLSIAHEDSHGRFIVTNYSVKLRDWLWDATNGCKRPIQRTKVFNEEQL